MPIATECPLCATKGVVPNAFSGKRVKCPKCCNLFVVTGVPQGSQLGNQKLPTMGNINLPGSKPGAPNKPGSHQGTANKPGSHQGNQKKPDGSHPGVQKTSGSKQGDFRRAAPATQEMPAFNPNMIAQRNGSAARPAAPSYGRQTKTGPDPIPLFLGMGALLIGGAGLAICWLPDFAYFGLALGAFGLFLGAIGLLVALIKKSGLVVNALACLICMPALVVPLFVSGDGQKKPDGELAGGTGRDPDTATGRDPTTKKEELPVVEEWADASKGPVKLGDAQVRLISVDVDSAKGSDGKMIAPKERHLVIRMIVENTNPTKKLEYKGAADPAMRSGDTQARLTDDQHAPYRVVYFGKDKPIAGQILLSTVDPKKSVTDVLVFDAPGDRANELHLELAGSHFGGAGKLKIKIPRSMVVVKLGPPEKDPPLDQKLLAQALTELKSPNAKIRLDAAVKIGSVGPKASMATADLTVALKDADPNVRTAVAEALGKIGPEAKAAIPQLALALKDPIPKVRSNAAQSLGQMGAEAKIAIPALIAAFADPDEETARKALEALKRIEASK